MGAQNEGPKWLKGSKQPTPIKSIWGGRKRAVGCDWLEVDPNLLRCALHVCCTAGHLFSFSAAAGGLGVCVTIFVNRVKHVEFARDADELHQLLAEVIETFASPSEDVRSMFGLADEGATAAD